MTMPATGPDGTELVVVPAADDTAGPAARAIATVLHDAVRERGRADWATTGGSTPVAIYRALGAADLRDGVPWANVHTWWGDDRFVPRDHPLSNVKPFDDVLRGEQAIPIPVENVHPFRTTEAIVAGRDPAACAADLAEELRAARLPLEAGRPVLDLMLLGIGGDGHLLSVFPGSAAFDAGAWAVAIPAPTHIEPHVERVTMHPALVEIARSVLVVVHGEAKAALLADVFGEVRDVRRWPAQLARRPGATWIIDAAAAADLPR
jgi:6-phosphogluconolactonase